MIVPDIRDNNIDNSWKIEHAMVSIFFDNILPDSKMNNLAIAYCRGNSHLRNLIKYWLTNNNTRMLEHYCNICNQVPLSLDDLLDEEASVFSIASPNGEKNEIIEYLKEFSFFQN